MDNTRSNVLLTILKLTPKIEIMHENLSAVGEREIAISHAEHEANDSSLVKMSFR